MALLGGIAVYLLEAEMLFVPAFLTTPGSTKEQAMNALVPRIIFFSKLGMSMAFLSTYQASFSDKTIFPQAVRATAIGQCQLFARGVTILAPMVSELAKPLPIMFFCGSCLLALIVSLSFQSEPTEEPKEATTEHLFDEAQMLLKQEKLE